MYSALVGHFLGVECLACNLLGARRSGSPVSACWSHEVHGPKPDVEIDAILMNGGSADRLEGAQGFGRQVDSLWEGNTPSKHGQTSAPRPPNTVLRLDFGQMFIENHI